MKVLYSHKKSLLVLNFKQHEVFRAANLIALLELEVKKKGLAEKNKRFSLTRVNTNNGFYVKFDNDNMDAAAVCLKALKACFFRGRKGSGCATINHILKKIQSSPQEVLS